MDQETKAALERLCREAPEKETNEYARRVATLTGGLPVYLGWTGDFFLTPQGEVMFYDSEREVIEPVCEEDWRLYALVKASQKFPELLSLVPARPENAVECVQCKGSGTVTIGSVTVDCGKCSSTGWQIL